VPGSLIDANLWVALTFDGHAFHGEATAVVSRASAGAPAYFCEASERSWLRLVTTPAIQRSCHAELLTNEAALELRANWLAQPGIGLLLEEPEGTRELWHRLAGVPAAAPKVWMDAYLAAFAISGGFEFVTLDGDFSKYERVGLNLAIPR